MGWVVGGSLSDGGRAGAHQEPQQQGLGVAWCTSGRSGQGEGGSDTVSNVNSMITTVPELPQATSTDEVI